MQHATYCLSCAQAVLTLQRNKVHERLKAVRDERNIVASLGWPRQRRIAREGRKEGRQAGCPESDEKLNEMCAQRCSVYVSIEVSGD